MKVLIFTLVGLSLFQAGWGFLKNGVRHRLSPKLQYVASELEQPANRNKQVFLLDFIIRSHDPLRNEVLKDVVLHDIQNATVYGNTRIFTVHARIHALTNIRYTPNDGATLWHILKFDKSFEMRRWAARMSRYISNDNFVRGLSYLINYDYYVENFRYTDPKMQQNNEIVYEMVVSLGKMGSHKAVPILLQIVHIQNHLPRTIEAAWKALERIPFPNPAYPYFILALRDSIEDKNDLVSISQKDQLDKTIQTLTEFITNNFGRALFTPADLDIVKGEREQAEEKSKKYPQE